MPIGFVGLGRMGFAMVEMLLRDGHAVMVWNRTISKAEPLVAQGAQLAPSLPALASACDTVFTILTDDAAVAGVYSGETGLLAGNVTGTLFVEMSTVRPDTIQTIATTAVQRKATLIDAPLSGGGKLIYERKLVALVGGDPADVERARPLLTTWCRSIQPMGATGSGAMTKLAVNNILCAYWMGMSESLAAADAFGLDLPRLLDVIADSSAGLRILPNLLPALRGEPHDVAFDMQGVRKDLMAITRSLHDLGIPAPMAEAALARYSAMVSLGYGAEDLTQMPARYRQYTGRPPSDS